MSLLEKDLALLMILAGPTGTGKSTLCVRMTEKYLCIQRVITSTTRPPREGESDGVDYFFFDEDTFTKKMNEGAFYESARVHDYLYGTLKSEIQNKLAQNIDLIMNVDVQGVEAFQKEAENDPLLSERLVTVFLMPPSLEEIEKRLLSRGNESKESIERRLESAQKEMPLWVDYDFCLVSGAKDDDFAKIENIWFAEKLRVSRLNR